MLINENTSNCNLILPAEICSIIIQFVQPLSKKDLCNFCRISQNFRSEAERLLYADVLLKGMRALKLWARVVHKRPHLSTKTRRVVFYIPRQTEMEADDLGWMSKGLKTCIALEDLRVFEQLGNHSHEGKRENYANSVNRWIIDGYRFKLKSFTNEYFQNHLLNEFLISQPDLESICLKGDDAFVTRLDNVPLTNVRSMDGTATTATAFLGNHSEFKRRLQHLQVSFCIYDRSDITFWQRVAQYNTTLQSLSLLETETSTWGHAFHMLPIYVYQQLPSIRHLRIISTKVYPTDFAFAHLGWQYVIPTAFERLEVLVLRLPSTPPTDKDIEQGQMGQCAYKAFRTPADRRASVSGAMSAMASLRRVDLGFDSELHRFLKSEHGIEESSVPVEEGYDRHDFDWRSESPSR